MSPVPFFQILVLCFSVFRVCFWSLGLLRCLLVINFLHLPAGSFQQWKSVANLQYSPSTECDTQYWSARSGPVLAAFVPLTITDPDAVPRPRGRRRFVCLLTNSFAMAATAVESLGTASQLGLWNERKLSITILSILILQFRNLAFKTCYYF